MLLVLRNVQTLYNFPIHTATATVVAVLTSREFCG